MSNYSRRSPKKMTRRERRSAGVRVYTTPSANVAAIPRRSYMAEPAPVDYTTEFGFVRKDLLRILVWAAVLVIAMIALSFLPIVDWLTSAGLF